MKRSDVIRRLGPALRTAIKSSEMVDGRDLVLIEEGAMTAIAEALGVPVEPDEPPLPDMLHTHSVSWNGTWEVSQLSRADGLAVGSIKASPRLLEAVVHAYNERPRWRTGVPFGSGPYLCKLGGEYVVYDNPEVAFYDPAAGWTWRAGGQVPMSVVAWMPIPEEKP